MTAAECRREGVEGRDDRDRKGELGCLAACCTGNHRPDDRGACRCDVNERQIVVSQVIAECGRPQARGFRGPAEAVGLQPPG